MLQDKGAKPVDVLEAVKKAAAGAAVAVVAKKVFDYAVPVAGKPQDLKISVPFNADFIRELKELVPYTCRRWDNDAKVWIISGADQQAVVHELIAKNFPDGVAKAKAVEKTAADCYEILHLRRSAPFELVVMAYELLMDMATTPLEKKGLEMAYHEIELLKGKEDKPNANVVT